MTVFLEEGLLLIYYKEFVHCSYRHMAVYMS